jgi:hypothetical protein
VVWGCQLATFTTWSASERMVWSRLRGPLWDATAVTTTRARSCPRSGGSVPSALAGLAAMAAGTAAALVGEVRWPAVGTALAGLAVAVAQERTVAACVLGRRPPPSCW